MILENATADHILRGIVLAAIALVWIIVLVRLVGLRSFSKMTSFDFIVTVACGSLLAGAAQADGWNAFLQSNAAMAGLLFCQFIAARARKDSQAVHAVLQNEPVLLMRDGKILDHALEATRVSRDDLIAKLREANVLEYDKVCAAVLETTGDVSVIHGDDMDERLIEGVRDLR